MAKRGRKKGWTTSGARKAFYERDGFCYCNYCGKEIYKRDAKIIPDPKGILRELKLCDKCYAKVNNQQF